MNAGLGIWEAVCIAGFVLSLRSIAVLRSRSPYTIAGWLFTAAYFALAAYDAWVRAHAPFHADYACVALLTIAFVVAGIRHEPQAVPWWWPTAEDAAPSTR
jgi:uncharacterized RDD family membrane protein YckC